MSQRSLCHYAACPGSTWQFVCSWPDPKQFTAKSTMISNSDVAEEMSIGQDSVMKPPGEPPWIRDQKLRAQHSD